MIDVLAAMKDKLNPDSRAAIEQWEAEKNVRHREMLAGNEEYNGPRRAMRERQQQQE